MSSRVPRILFPALAVTLAAAVDGAVLTVDSLADSVAPDGACTLREAVAAAEGATNDCGAGSAGVDEIDFDGALSGRIDLLGGPLVISGGLRIAGPGSDRLTIDAGRTSRIFEVEQPSGSEFAVSKLSLSNGSSTGHGGAIVLTGATALLQLDGVVIDSSYAAGSGAALAVVEPASVEIRILRSAFLGNEADAGAGALDLLPAATGTAATVIIEDTRFDDNDSAGGSAVMLACDGNPCDIAIRRSGFVRNVGGHLEIVQQAPPAANVLELAESGFYSLPRATVSGGVRITGGSGAVRLLNNSFGPNEADGALPPQLWLDLGSPTAIAVIAFNSFESSFDRTIEVVRGEARLKGNGIQFPGCVVGGDGTLTSLGENVIGGGTFYEGACGLSQAANDRFDERPLFAVQSPFDDGGSMPPHSRPRVGGPVIDAVTDCTVPDTGPLTAFALDRDQRGSARPVEGIDAPRCDAGAVEVGGHLVVEFSGNGEGVLRFDPPVVLNEFDAVDTSYDPAFTNVPRTRSFYRWPGDATVLSGEGNANDRFDGFSGDCSGTGPCTLGPGPAMLGASFTSFQDLFPLNVEVVAEPGAAATGRITSSPEGIDCDASGGAGCEAFFAPGTEVTLTVATGPGALFLGWSSAFCSGRGVCRVTMDGPRPASALFGGDVIVRISFEDGE